MLVDGLRGGGGLQLHKRTVFFSLQEKVYFLKHSLLKYILRQSELSEKDMQRVCGGRNHL